MRVFIPFLSRQGKKDLCLFVLLILASFYLTKAPTLAKDYNRQKIGTLQQEMEEYRKLKEKLEGYIRDVEEGKGYLLQRPESAKEVIPWVFREKELFDKALAGKVRRGILTKEQSENVMRILEQKFRENLLKANSMARDFMGELVRRKFEIASLDKILGTETFGKKKEEVSSGETGEISGTGIWKSTSGMEGEIRIIINPDEGTLACRLRGHLQPEREGSQDERLGKEKTAMADGLCTGFFKGELFSGVLSEGHFDGTLQMTVVQTMGEKRVFTKNGNIEGRLQKGTFHGSFYIQKTSTEIGEYGTFEVKMR